MNQDSIFWELLDKLEGGKGSMRLHVTPCEEKGPSLLNKVKKHSARLFFLILEYNYTFDMMTFFFLHF